MATPTSVLYTLSLHDALPISGRPENPGGLRHDLRQADGRCVDDRVPQQHPGELLVRVGQISQRSQDRKSTRLNSSHSSISYAVFCLKKKMHDTSYERRRLL